MHNKIILFSTNCPKCNVLETKLNNAKIKYELQSEDLSEIIDLGFMEAPILKINDDYLTFKEANNWINEYKG